MASITITLTDLPNFRVSVSTDAARPVVGHSVTPAQANAMELLGTAFKRGCEVVYDASQVPLVALALELLHPEGLGWAVTPEVRDRARVALGRPRAEREPMPGVDIDRVHRTRPPASSPPDKSELLRKLLEELKDRCDNAETKEDGRISTLPLRTIYTRAVEALA